MPDDAFTLDRASIQRLRTMLDWYEGQRGLGEDTRAARGGEWIGDAKIISATGSSPPFSYTVRLQRTGGSGIGGMRDLNTKDWPADNLWEGISGGKAGYENTSVTTIKKIPVGAFVRVRWGYKSGTRILVFAERNEPTC